MDRQTTIARPAKTAAVDRAHHEQASKDRLWLLLVALAGLLAYLPWLGSCPPLDPTDSFFIESAREIVETGQYLLPLNNYEPWLDKPILFFWMVALSLKTLGVSAFAARLPVALCAVALAMILFTTTRAWLSRRAAFLAALVFLSLPLVSVIGHVCLSDMTLSLLVSGSILFMFRGLRQSAPRDVLIGYVLNALAILCKGPIASILCGAVLLSTICLERRSLSGIWSDVRRLNPLLGILVALAVNLPWYAAAILVTKGRFFEAFFFEQNFGRMVGTVNHQMPWWFYIPVFAGGFFPWCLLTVLVPKYVQKAILKSDSAPRHLALFRLALCWFLVVMAIFSAIKTKLPTYILPAAPAFAILIAMQLNAILLHRLSRRLLWFGVLSLVVVGVAAAMHGRLPEYLRPTLAANLWAVCLVMSGLAAACGALCARRGWLAVSLIGASTATACAVFVPQGMASFHEAKQADIERLVRIVKDKRGTLALLMADKPAMRYILHRRTYRLRDLQSAQHFMAVAEPPLYVLMPSMMLGNVSWFSNGVKLIDHSDKWHLYVLENTKKVSATGEAYPKLDRPDVIE